MDKYMIKIDDDYFVDFDNERDQNQLTLSMYKSDAKIFENELDLKYTLDNLFEVMKYSGFSFDHLEIFCYED